MPNFDIACVESRIQGPRDYYSKFIIDNILDQLQKLEQSILIEESFD